MPVLNWEPLGRKVQAALAELGWDEDRLYALAESEISEAMDHGLEDPYELMLHVFGPEGDTLKSPTNEGPQFIITQSLDEPNTLRLDMARFVDILEDIFPDGIPDGHPMATLNDGKMPKAIQFPEPDYDEDEGTLN